VGPRLQEKNAGSTMLMRYSPAGGIAPGKSRILVKKRCCFQTIKIGGNFTMADDVYKKMLEVMKNRRGSYTGLDIPEFYPLVQALFTPEEAEVNNAMPRKQSTANDIAKELGKPEKDIIPTLETMVDRGLCKTFLKDDVRYYQGEPFMPGIFE
jgi:hypothetical protein